MKTRITELLGVKHPIMLAGMAFVSLPKLVAAVSNAGGIGMLNSVAYSPNQMKDVIKRDKISYGQTFWGQYHTAISQCQREYGGSS